MNELKIEIRIQNQTEAVYRFSSFPVKIGRAPTCDLSICHNVIARELCTAWIESDGRIRLEEKPNLTNPIIENQKPLLGGISKKSISANVGPVQLLLSVDNGISSSSPSKWRRKLAFFTAIFATVVVFLGLSSVIWKNNDSQDALLSPAAFPNTLSFDFTEADSTSPAQLQILKRYAVDQYYRIPIEISNRRTAIQTLHLVLRIQQQNGLSSAETKQQLTQWKRNINEAYQRETATLFAAIKCNDTGQVKNSVHKLKAYLNGQHTGLDHKLDTLSTKGNKP